MNLTITRIFLEASRLPLQPPPPTTPDQSQQEEINQAVEDTKEFLDRIPGLNFDALGPFGQLIFYITGGLFTAAVAFGVLTIAYGGAQVAWPGSNATRVSNGKKNMGRGGLIAGGFLFFGAIALWAVNIVQSGTG